MPKLSIVGFDGIIPRTSPTMLADNQAQLAENVKLYSHELRYWRGPLAQTATLPTNTQSIYKYYAAATDPYWLAWASNNVDVVLSPLADVSDYRFYYTGDGVPKKSNESLASTGTGPYPRSWRNMGVPAPVAAPTTSVARTGTVVTMSPSTVVTITLANPAVVTQTAHGYVAGQIVEFTTTGALPAPIVASTQYFVINPATNTYQLATTVGGTAIDTSAATQSGVQTVHADPAVVTHTNHGFLDGQIVEFTTTGTLPAPIVAGTTYVVLNKTDNTYQLATAAVGGTAIVTGTATQSGVHKVYADDNPDSRTYVYTYTSTFGAVTEESAPSPPTSVITVYQGSAADPLNPGRAVVAPDTVTINGFTAPPSTNYNITGINIYRSVSGTQSDTYLFVASIPIATTSYADSLLSYALGNAIPSIGWFPPPSDLTGLVGLPSGSLAGFSKNTVYFSEPFHPHAWPVEYALSFPYKIVGLGVFGTSVAVMTERYPYIINGVLPGSMSVQDVPALEPCINKRSIVSSALGVWYATPNGLMQIGPSGSEVVTKPLFRRDEWQEVHPSNIIAALYDTKYFALYPSTSGFTPFILSTDDTPALSTIKIAATAVHVDAKSGNLFYVDPATNTIFQADADALNPMTYQWHSKRFVMPMSMTFSAIKVDADYTQVAVAAAYNARLAALKAANAALFSSPLMGCLNDTPVDTYVVDGSILATLPLPAEPLTAQVLIYGDDALKATMTFEDFGVKRVPSFKAKTFEFVLRGNISIRSMVMAPTVQELIGE